MPLSVAILVMAGVASCQPSPWETDCHCLGSPFGTTSSGDLAKAAAPQNALMMQARTNFLGKLLNFFRLLNGGEREHEAVVLFQVSLQLLGQVDERGGVLQRLLVFGFKDFILLRLTVGQTGVAIYGRRLAIVARGGLESQREQWRQYGESTQNAFHNRTCNHHSVAKKGDRQPFRRRRKTHSANCGWRKRCLSPLFAALCGVIVEGLDDAVRLAPLNGELSAGDRAALEPFGEFIEVL